MLHQVRDDRHSLGHHDVARRPFPHDWDLDDYGDCGAGGHERVGLGLLLHDHYPARIGGRLTAHLQPEMRVRGGLLGLGKRSLPKLRNQYAPRGGGRAGRVGEDGIGGEQDARGEGDEPEHELGQDVLPELLEDLHVLVRRCEAHTDSMNAQMRDTAHCAPRRDLRRLLLRRDLGQGHPPLDAEPGRVTPGLFDIAVEPIDDGLRLRTGPKMGHPPVRHACGPMHDHRALPTHPDGDRAPRGERIDPGVGDPVPLSLDGDQLSGPQRAHDRDLLLDALSAVLEILTERLELHGIPPHSPTPKRRRPRESTSTAAACFATSAVCRCGRMRIPVTSSTRWVTAARKPNSTNGSWNTCRYMYGPFQPPGRSGFAPRTWSNTRMWV